MGPESLSELERELLELCGMACETTTTLHEEMQEAPPDRATLEATLRGLVARGLMETERGVYAGVQRPRDGSPAFRRVYEDDWWDLTREGQRAVDLPRRPPIWRWSNPSSGPFRRPRIQAALYGVWFRVSRRIRWLLDNH